VLHLADTPFRKVWIKARAGDAYTISWGKKISAFLLSKGVEVYVDPLLGYSIDAKVLPETMLSNVDLAIIIGGDGTLLRTVQKSRGVLPPILGFSAKSLGFFFENDVEYYPSVLEKILGGKFVLHKVALGEYSVENFNGVFLNEVSAWAEKGKVIEYEVVVGDQLFYHARSDGIIINTPAGSAGHALSYNMPLFFVWNVPLLSFLPVGALSPLIKPFIVSEKTIKVKFLTWPSIIVVDGQRRYEAKSGTVLETTIGRKWLELVYLGREYVTPAKLRRRFFDRGFSGIP